MATPVLASTLLSTLLRQEKAHRRYRNVSHEGNEENRIRSGVDELDDYVLLGGVERGSVVGVSAGGDGHGDGGGAGRLISLHLLTTALMSNPVAKASIIDTTGSFPVSQLAKIIRLRIVSQPGQTGHRVGKLETVRAIHEKLQEILGRVAISRVFDIEGVWEVLSEISADCQSHTSGRDLSDLTKKIAEVPDRTSDLKAAAAGAARTRSLRVQVHAERQHELEIGDSEAEDEDFSVGDSLEEAEVSQVGNTNLTEGNTISQAPIDIFLAREDSALGSELGESKRRTEIIIIDNMTTPISELFSHRERTSAHTLLSTFSRTLRTLSQTHNILTLLLNTLKTPIAPIPSQQYHNQGHHHHNHIQGPGPNHNQEPRHSRIPTSHSMLPNLTTNPTSVFAATSSSRPSLGRLFSDLCALHLLITRVPKTAKDAERLYASPPSPPLVDLDTDADADANLDLDTPADDHEETHTPPRDDDHPQHRGQDFLSHESRIEYALVIEVLKDTTTTTTTIPPLSRADLDSHRGGRSLPRSRGRPRESSLREREPEGAREREVTRKRNRTQRWGAFQISTGAGAGAGANGAERGGEGGDPVMLQNAFGPGIAATRHTGGAKSSLLPGDGQGQMHIAKQFSFGRRV